MVKSNRLSDENLKLSYPRRIFSLSFTTFSVFLFFLFFGLTIINMTMLYVLRFTVAVPLILVPCIYFVLVT